MNNHCVLHCAEIQDLKIFYCIVLDDNDIFAVVDQTIMFLWTLLIMERRESWHFQLMRFVYGAAFFQDVKI